MHASLFMSFISWVHYQYSLFSLDNQGRYAYDLQPEICRWNLKKLAEALIPNGLTEDKIKEGLEM